MSVLPNVPCRGHHRHYNRRLWRARTGGTCDACDKAVAPTQLVMAVPGGEKKIVHLHADCFMLWNALRPRAGDADRVMPVTDLRPLSA